MRENLTNGQHFQAAEFLKATKMHSGNIYRRKILYLAGERCYLCRRCKRAGRSCLSSIGTPLSGIPLQLETEQKIIPFISKLFWETTFFHTHCKYSIGTTL